MAFWKSKGLKMENRLIELFLSFREKGYMAIEIPWLIKDAIHITANSEHTITDINRELEDLGWGIEIIDNATYKQIISFVDNRDSSNYWAILSNT